MVHNKYLSGKKMANEKIFKGKFAQSMVFTLSSNSIMNNFGWFEKNQIMYKLLTSSKNSLHYLPDIFGNVLRALCN